MFCHISQKPGSVCEYIEFDSDKSANKAYMRPLNAMTGQLGEGEENTVILFNILSGESQHCKVPFGNIG